MQPDQQPASPTPPESASGPAPAEHPHAVWSRKLAEAMVKGLNEKTANLPPAPRAK